MNTVANHWKLKQLWHCVCLFVSYMTEEEEVEKRTNDSFISLLSFAVDSASLKQKIWHMIISVFFLDLEVVFHPNYAYA